MENDVENILSNSDRTIHTMYTPRTRGRQQFSLGISFAPAEEIEDINTLQELLNKTWTIFGVSTLFNFYQDEICLKQYAKKLREEVANNLTQEDVTYNTEFCIMENIILRPSPMDPPPIKIEVYSEKNNNEESSKKCIYKGIFLSWRTTKNTLTDNSIRLPLLLCRSTQGTMGIVHTILSRMFDCMIVTLSAHEDDLLWLIPIVITPTTKEEQPKSKDEIHMEYKIPELPDTDTITIKFKILDLIKILTVIIKDQNDEASLEMTFNLEHIEKFREVLYSQILELAGLQLGLCTLHKIHLPTLTIMENKMKVMSADTMNRVLLYLNEKALDMFHTLNLEM
ncbi:centromere protein L-like [Apis laboriosa]|uniref:centromere protein L-like n=1 Tax=Apis laboriosa TaxID=183418 RepID=UPI001CC7CFFA|nr:centromere protein L-like [Apis laboriosa]XP_043799396.1 centromere protein L-like [Apis laboriosa]XP_043799397.1 centromere protein L-like [Apis laboriosa]